MPTLARPADAAANIRASRLFIDCSALDRCGGAGEIGGELRDLFIVETLRQLRHDGARALARLEGLHLLDEARGRLASQARDRRAIDRAAIRSVALRACRGQATHSQCSRAGAILSVR